MWVRTTTGNLVNVHGAKEIVIEPCFDFSPSEAMQIIAHFHSGEVIPLAVVIDDDAQAVEEAGRAMYRALVETFRNGEGFCDLMQE